MAVAVKAAALCKKEYFIITVRIVRENHLEAARMPEGRTT